MKLGIHHIALRTSNFDKAFAFYTALGMRHYATWGEGNGKISLLEISEGQYLELFAGGTEEKATAPRYLHLALAVDDVNAAYEEALRLGASPKSAPNVVPLSSAPVRLTLHCAFVYGPTGEEVEFFRVLAAE